MQDLYKDIRFSFFKYLTFLKVVLIKNYEILRNLADHDVLWQLLDFGSISAQIL